MSKFLVKTSHSVDIKLHILLNSVKAKSGIICGYTSNKLKKPNIILYVKGNPEEYIMVQNTETILHSLMNLTGHIYICNAPKLPINSQP